jgi:hypothetical protein
MIWSKRIQHSGYKAAGIGFTGKKFVIQAKEWNPEDNYHGVSTFSPDVLLSKPPFYITISLQGAATPHNEDEKLKELWQNRKIRYICFAENDTILWQTWSGEIPPNEIIEKFSNHI